MNIFSTGLHLLFIVVALVLWKLRFFPSNSLVANHKTTLVWLAFMSACAISLYFALEKWSSPSVRDDAGEVSFCLIFSLVWIALTQRAFAFLGISIRDDVAGRRSRSAGLAAAGLTIAAACCVAGANIGDGPGFEVVLFCSVLATFYLLVLWFLTARASGLADSITIACDLGAGIRAGAWFAGTGVVIGACVAGDWISVAATLRDFVRYAWPLAIFARALDRCRLVRWSESGSPRYSRLPEGSWDRGRDRACCSGCASTNWRPA
jgi:hypothetical protein